MKQRLSISMEEESVELLQQLLRNTEFRNRSHVIKHSILRLSEEVNGHE